MRGHASLIDSKPRRRESFLRLICLPPAATSVSLIHGMAGYGKIGTVIREKTGSSISWPKEATSPLPWESRQAGTLESYSPAANCTRAPWSKPASVRIGPFVPVARAASFIPRLVKFISVGLSSHLPTRRGASGASHRTFQGFCYSEDLQASERPVDILAGGWIVAPVARSCSSLDCLRNEAIDKR